MQVKIIKMGINGEGIAYLKQKPVFIRGALVDEIVEIVDLKDFNTYYTATLQHVHEKSKFRVKPKCQIASLCGGCSLMHCMVKKQLEYKVSTLKETLIKYANLRDCVIKPIKASEDYYRYRNQLKFPVKMINGKLESGMYEDNTQHLVTIEHCMIHETQLEAKRKEVMAVLNQYQIKDYYAKLESGLRMVILRGFNNQFQLTLVTGKNKIDEACVVALSEIKGINSVYQNVNVDESKVTSDDYRCLAGSKTIELKIDQIVLRLSPASFFQLNLKQAIELYRYVVDLIEPCDFIVEAYSGIGAMSIMASGKAKHIEGVEIVKDAVKNASTNAKFNHLEDHVKFVCDDAGQYLRKQTQSIDYLLVDPPRKGLDHTMIQAIRSSLPKNIIYVSCNPSTLAKNISDLDDEYEVQHIQPFDMFTHTAHVESVILMTLR